MIAGSLEIQMSANIARLADDMAKAKAMVGDATKSMSDAVGSLKSMFASLGVGLSIAGFADLTKNAANAADQAAKLSDRFGIATETLIGMQHAADLAGVSQDGLSNALKGIAKSSVDAMQGTEASRLAYQRLGIEVSTFLKLPMDQQLSLVIDRLGKMENATVRNATAQAVMGRQAGQMAGLVAEGSKAFQEAEEDTKAWGLALDRVDAAKIELANDAMKRADAAGKGLFTTIALNLAPMIAGLANGFADASKEANGFRDQVVESTGFTVEAIGYLLNALQGVKYAYMAIKVVLADFTGATLESFSMIAKAVSDNPITKWAARLPGAMGEAARAVQQNAGDIGDDLHSLAQGFFDVGDSVQKELNDLIAQGLPHDKFVAFVARMKTEMDSAAKQIAAQRAAMNQGGGDLGITPKDQYNAALAAQLSALLTHNQTALQIIEQRYTQEQSLLNEAREKEFITDDYWQGQSMLVFARYQDARATAIYQEQEQQRQKAMIVTNLEMNTWQLAADFLQVFAGKSKAAAIAVIAIQKALAIAQVIQQTAVASMAAFAPPPIGLGPVAGAALAAQIQSLGAIQIALIAATGIAQASQVGSGGASAGSVSNPIATTPGIGSTAPATSLPASSQTVVNVNITNSGVLGDDGIRKLVQDEVIPQIKDAVDNRDIVIIGQNSRQAAILQS
jgi:hypothetical protein